MLAYTQPGIWVVRNIQSIWSESDESTDVRSKFPPSTACGLMADYRYNNI